MIIVVSITNNLDISKTSKSGTSSELLLEYKKLISILPWFLLHCLQNTFTPDYSYNTRTRVRVPVEMHVFHISIIVLVPWSSCLGGYSSVPDDYPLVLGCEEHVSSLGVFVA